MGRTRALSNVAASSYGCRDVGHSWAPYDAVIERKFIQRILKCRNCTTLRIQTLDKNYDVVSNTYRYPDGYLVEGAGRLSASDRARIRAWTTKNFPQRKGK